MEDTYDAIYLKFQAVSEDDGTMGRDELSLVLQDLGIPVNVVNHLLFHNPASLGVNSADGRINATSFLQWICGQEHDEAMGHRRRHRAWGRPRGLGGAARTAMAHHHRRVACTRPVRGAWGGIALGRGRG